MQPENRSSAANERIAQHGLASGDVERADTEGAGLTDHGEQLRFRRLAADGRLPVVNFSAGGLATPADAALMMQLGAEGVFVGSGIFKSADPPARARAIVHATTHFEDPKAIADASEALGEAMPGLDVKELDEGSLLQHRGC